MHELSFLERLALEGIAGRQREVAARVKADFAALMELVERRLGLPTGSIGKTHLLDMDSLRVVEKPPADPGPPAAT